MMSLQNKVSLSLSLICWLLVQISLKNVHFVNPKFTWTQMLILGTCLKTSITVESFSPLETGYGQMRFSFTSSSLLHFRNYHEPVDFM